MELSIVKTYWVTTPVLAILSKPNSHVIPSKGNKTMQALTAALQCRLTKKWGQLTVLTDVRQNQYLLKFKKEFTRSSSKQWTNTLYRRYLHRFANFCAENKFWSSFETLESVGEMKLMMKLYLPFLHNFYELWNLFSCLPIGIFFSFVSGNCLYLQQKEL